jgi:hypothetical protein
MQKENQDFKYQLIVKNKKINEMCKKLEENGINSINMEKLDISNEEKEKLKSYEIKFEEINNFFESNENYFNTIEILTDEIMMLNKN